MKRPTFDETGFSCGGISCFECEFNINDKRYVCKIDQMIDRKKTRPTLITKQIYEQVLLENMLNFFDTAIKKGTK
jgi:hypothetical protein